MDMNVSNYSLSELLTITGIDDDNLNSQQIIKNTNALMNKFKNKNQKLVDFFSDVQNELLHYVEGLEYNENDDDENDKKDTSKIFVEGFGNMANEATYSAGDKQITDWYNNEYLNQSDSTQNDKITQRKQKVEVFGNNHVQMKRQQIATTDTYNLPVKQDSLNPNLKNTINRFINLDSQFRQYTNGQDSTSTDYTCDLSDTLKNALQISLYSYQIPFSWYVIDKAYGNTCLWIIDPSSGIVVPVSVPSGNYSPTAFQTQLNSSFTAAGFTFPPFPSGVTGPVSYNPNNGIITLYLYNGFYDGDLGTFDITTSTNIIFFDFTGVLQCNVNCRSKSNHYLNCTLGWLMGFRVHFTAVSENGNTASSVLDLNGTKYLILIIDDYNQNHVNNSLVSVSQFSNTLKMPSYYTPDLPYTCQTPVQQGNNLASIIAQLEIQTLFDDQTSNINNGLLIAGKYESDNSATQIVLPSAPRTLTQSQIYTINSINNNNNNLTNYLSKAPTSADILAIIPVKTSASVPTGSLLVEFSGSLQDNKRTYFGPVNIDRMAVKLVDDKGITLNLNGLDWCCTINCECLYQY